MRVNPSMRSPASSIIAGLSGCDSLASSDYVGQPLFTLTGTFVSTTTAPQDPVGGLALLWQDPSSAGGPGVAATTVPVAVAFPSTFHVDVPVPPPDAARFAFPDADVTLAETYVFVVADPTAAQLEPCGTDHGHALIYASADVIASTARSRLPRRRDDRRLSPAPASPRARPAWRRAR